MKGLSKEKDEGVNKEANALLAKWKKASEDEKAGKIDPSNPTSKSEEEKASVE